MTLVIRNRRLIEINTDPQRRCYNGCHAKSELIWSEWGVLGYAKDSKDAENKLKFWRDLNDYAVSQRGEVNTKCEFEAVEETV